MSAVTFVALVLELIVVLLIPVVAGAQRLTPIPVRRPSPFARPVLSSASPWQPLTNQPTFLDVINCYGASNPLFLTDGIVMVQEGACQHWWRLTPDETGSYVNGTWSQLATLPPNYSPLYHASAVLPDGRVIIEGGEYNFLNPVWTTLGAIYDPRGRRLAAGIAAPLLRRHLAASPNHRRCSRRRSGQWTVYAGQLLH